MDSTLCFLKNPLSWLSVLGPVLIPAYFVLGQYGFLSVLLTCTILILSTVIFAFSKQRPKQAEKLDTSEVPGTNQEGSPHMEDVITPVAATNESMTENEETNAEEEAGSSPVMLSESDCHFRSSTSEDSEIDWMYQDNMFHCTDFSDGSISDEDSLIEIALPSGHYIDHKEEEPKLKKFPDFAPGAFFRQHGLMELFAELNEMNEEENLIEIDISMGSIKCPRFEIEA